MISLRRLPTLPDDLNTLNGNWTDNARKLPDDDLNPERRATSPELSFVRPRRRQFDASGAVVSHGFGSLGWDIMN